MPMDFFTQNKNWFYFLTMTLKKDGSKDRSPRQFGTRNKELGCKFPNLIGCNAIVQRNIMRLYRYRLLRGKIAQPHLNYGLFQTSQKAIVKSFPKSQAMPRLVVGE